MAVHILTGRYSVISSKGLIEIAAVAITQHGGNFFIGERGPFHKTRMDTHVVLPQIPGLPKRSMVEAEQRYAVDKAQIIRYIDKLDDSVMKEVTNARYV